MQWTHTRLGNSLVPETSSRLDNELEALACSRASRRLWHPPASSREPVELPPPGKRLHGQRSCVRFLSHRYLGTIALLHTPDPLHSLKTQNRRLTKTRKSPLSIKCPHNKKSGRTLTPDPRPLLCSIITSRPLRGLMMKMPQVQKRMILPPGPNGADVRSQGRSPGTRAASTRALKGGRRSPRQVQNASACCPGRTSPGPCGNSEITRMQTARKPL
jgi:hypothetical protein